VQAAEFDSQQAFHGALHALVEEACALRLRRITLVHESFEGWPLETPSCSRRSRLSCACPAARWPSSAAGWSGCARAQPALCRVAPGLGPRPEHPHARGPGRAPSGLALGRPPLCRRARRRPGLGREPHTRADSREVVLRALDIDARMQRSVPAFPGSILGL
jgi:hypothetical protein